MTPESLHELEMYKTHYTGGQRETLDDYADLAQGETDD